MGSTQLNSLNSLPQNDSLFLEAIATWCNENENDIRTIYDWGLGWEGWAQVQINFVFLRLYDRLRWTSQREEMTYLGSTERADFVIRDYKNTPIHVVELKCLSQSKTVTQFTKDTSYDFVKIAGNMEDTYGYATKWSIAISCTGDDLRLNPNWHIIQVGNAVVISFRRLVGKPRR